MHHIQQTAFENIVGKAEIARNEQFLLFPQCFLLHKKIVSPFVNTFEIIEIISLFGAELKEPKTGIRDNGLSQDLLNMMHCRDRERERKS